MTKTYKREAASVVMAFNLALWTLSAFGHADATHAAETLMWPSFAAFAGAFGLDAFIKQVMPARQAPA